MQFVGLTRLIQSTTTKCNRNDISLNNIMKMVMVESYIT